MHVVDMLAQLWRLEVYNSGGTAVHLSQLVIALAVIVLGATIARRLSSLLELALRRSGKLPANTVYFIHKLAFYLLIACVLVVALPIAGIPITILTVLGGALAIGVGLGAQTLFKNLISSLIILFEHPIRIGDILEIDGLGMKVEDIGARRVILRRPDGVEVLVPSSDFLEKPVVNWTLSDKDVRGTVTVGVAYGSDAGRVRNLLLQTARAHERVLPTPEPSVLFSDFGDNALMFDLQFWTRVERP